LLKNRKRFIKILCPSRISSAGFSIPAISRKSLPTKESEEINYFYYETDKI